MSSGDQLVLDERAHEVEVGLRRRREADLDLLEAELEEQVEEPLLPRRVHRVDERLVPVAQVGRAPDRRPVEHDVRPGAIGQVDGVVRAVLVERHRHRGSLLRRTDFSRGVRVHGNGYVESLDPLAGKEPGKEEAKRNRAEDGGKGHATLSDHRGNHSRQAADEGVHLST